MKDKKLLWLILAVTGIGAFLWWKKYQAIAATTPAPLISSDPTSLPTNLAAPGSSGGRGDPRG